MQAFFICYSTLFKDSIISISLILFDITIFTMEENIIVNIEPEKKLNNAIERPNIIKSTSSEIITY